MPGGVVAFVVGRPAAGKRTVIAAARQVLEDAGLPSAYVSDLDYIGRVIADPAMQHRLAEVEDGVVIVDRDTVFDEALQYVASGVASEPAPIVFVDFARANYCKAIDRLAELGCKPDLVVYVSAPLWTCVRRNESRKSEGKFFVPTQTMNEIYTLDDLDALRRKEEGRILEINNEEDGEAAIAKVAKQLAGAVKKALDQPAA